MRLTIVVRDGFHKWLPAPQTGSEWDVWVPLGLIWQECPQYMGIHMVSYFSLKPCGGYTLWNVDGSFY